MVGKPTEPMLGSPFSLRAGWKAKQQPLFLPLELVDHALWAKQAPVPLEREENSVRRKELHL
jgi:hypothetical protein